MIRRGQQRKVDERRVDKVASSNLETGTYQPPDRGTCREVTYPDYVDDEATVKIESRLWTLNGKLVDFVLLVQEQDLSTGDWRNVARVDCCHGHAHLHPADDGPAEESLHRLDEVGDVLEAHEVAYRRIAKHADTIVKKEEL